MLLCYNIFEIKVKEYETLAKNKVNKKIINIKEKNMENKFIKFKDKQGLKERLAFSSENENQVKMVAAVVKEIEKRFPKLEIRDEFIKDFVECSEDVFVFEMDEKDLENTIQELVNCVRKQDFFLDIEFVIGFNIGSFALVNEKIKDNKYIIKIDKEKFEGEVPISDEDIKNIIENPYASELQKLFEGFGMPRELEYYVPNASMFIEDVDDVYVIYCNGGWSLVINKKKKTAKIEGMPYELVEKNYI